MDRQQVIVNVVIEATSKKLYLRLGTSKNKPYSSNATKLPANDSASFPFRFINVHSEAVSDRQPDQFFEVPIRHSFDAIWSPPRSEHHKTGLSRLRHRLGPAVCVKLGEYRGDVKFGRVE